MTVTEYEMIAIASSRRKSGRLWGALYWCWSKLPVAGGPPPAPSLMAVEAGKLPTLPLGYDQWRRVGFVPGPVEVQP